MLRDFSIHVHYYPTSCSLNNSARLLYTKTKSRFPYSPTNSNKKDGRKVFNRQLIGFLHHSFPCCGNKFQIHIQVAFFYLTVGCFLEYQLMGVVCIIGKTQRLLFD